MESIIYPLLWEENANVHVKNKDIFEMYRKIKFQNKEILQCDFVDKNPPVFEELFIPNQSQMIL